MAGTYTTAVKNARMDAVAAKADAGAGPGKLEIGTAGMATILLTHILNDPCAPNAVGGVLTLAGFPKSVAAGNAGDAAEARIRDSDNNDVRTGMSVGTTGTDVILDSVTIAAGQTVTINSATLTHAA